VKTTNYIQTYSGIMIDPFNPDPKLILLPDIAHALSNQCRFGGHVREFHSVAQHCVEAANLLRMEGPYIQLAGLLHDATEAYLVDVPKPIKYRLPEYIKAEERLMEAIAKKFGVPLNYFDMVHDSDGEALAIEALTLMSPLHPRFPLSKSEIENVSGLSMGECWAPKEAEQKYLDKFSELWKKKREA
jgi:hypothetical protein